MSEPSYKSSTLSQAFIGSLACYWLVILIVSAGLIWAKMDAEQAKLIIGWASALAGSVMAAYLTARRVGNGAPDGGQPPTP